MLLYQSSNFVQSLSNCPRFGTILFSITISDTVFISASAANIYTLNILPDTISVVLFPSKISFSVILSNFSSISILVASCLVLSILSVQWSNHNAIFFVSSMA